MDLMHVFFGVSMSNGHNGLTQILHKNPKTKEQVGYAVFINKSWTALKMTTPQNVVLHLKTPKNRPIDPHTIKHLPNCVNGQDINYNKALSTVLETEYKKLQRKH